MRVLVAITSHGTGNDQYLSQVIKEYRSMPYDIDVVVFSNIPKEVAPNVEIVVGLPNKNPWSLTFAHRPIFAHRLNDYDLFIYSENDILIKERNIKAFLRVSAVLPHSEIAGFLRIETAPDGRTFYPDVHDHFHWDSRSVRSRDQYSFAYFTNEHAACYLLTRQQLKRAINSRGFLVGPHEGKYDVPCTAATDPYTQCGVTKLICVSHLNDFSVHHLSNKYVGKLGVEDREFYRQIEALLRNGRNGSAPTPLFETQTKLTYAQYSKPYYEPINMAILSLIPSGIRSVLSVGCGWGATEGELTKKGIRVVGVPLDPVISACAEARGVEIVQGDFETARQKLAGERFDCLLMSNILHLVGDPIEVLSSFASLLSDNALAIALVPNFLGIPELLRVVRTDLRIKDLASYEKTGVHPTSHGVLRKWFKSAGLNIDRVVNILTKRAQIVSRATLGLVDPWFASEIIAVARKIRASC